MKKPMTRYQLLKYAFVGVQTEKSKLSQELFAAENKLEHTNSYNGMHSFVTDYETNLIRQSFPLKIEQLTTKVNALKEYEQEIAEEIREIME